MDHSGVCVGEKRYNQYERRSLFSILCSDQTVCPIPLQTEGHNSRGPFFCIIQGYVSSVLAVKLNQVSKMLNRLFFEMVVIWDKFLSTFTSKSHFSQIEFQFQASPSKNILTDWGKNILFSLKCPPSTE